jgi:predicted ester cyclase
MDNTEKLERNKKFIMSYYTEMVDSGIEVGEEVVRKYTDNATYIRGVLAFRNAFPNYEIFVEDITAEGDFVITHGIFKGTHKGEIFGIPATFRTVQYPMMVKYHIVNNKILDAWPMYDQMSLFEQLGVLPKTL